jgi:hypothetical protein
VYAVRVLINKTDNSVVQNSNIRHHIAMTLQNIAEQAALHDSTIYGIAWQGSLEATTHVTGLPFISLAIQASSPSHPLGVEVPFPLLWSIDHITASPSVLTDYASWNGLCKKVTLEQILNLKFMQNAAYRHSICWCLHGSDILFYIGYEIQPFGNYADYDAPDPFVIMGRRNPLIDNMLPENTLGSSFTQNIDLPDRYVRLLILQAAKAVMMQIGEVVLPDMDSQIAQLTQQLVGTNKQVEMSNSSKEYNMVPNDGYVMR